MAERDSRPPYAEIGPRKGMKNCWKFREEQPSPPPPLPLPFFPALHLINLASRSLCISDFLTEGGGKKKKETFQAGRP